ncbi:MAG: GlsB/YeaQ/YmgE family stress response membrane protein [Acidobacteria bacterium]|nr:MAG: GlsB/YeaQ/YmgE family stress response membrane protein [Acidobacteriota bacterium]
MDFIIAVIVGGIVGWLGSLIMKTSAQMGILANVIVGIVGSSLGFWLAGLLGLGASGAIMRWVIAVLGAVILIAILKALNIFK